MKKITESKVLFPKWVVKWTKMHWLKTGKNPTDLRQFVVRQLHSLLGTNSRILLIQEIAMKQL